MCELKKRKVRGAQYTGKVGLETLRGLKTVKQIAQEFGVHPLQVGQWKKEIEESAAKLLEGERGPKAVSERSEAGRLYSEVGKLMTATAGKFPQSSAPQRERVLTIKSN